MRFSVGQGDGRAPSSAQTEAPADDSTGEHGSADPPALWDAAQTELEELAELLRSEGLDTYVARRGEPFHAHVQESAQQAVVEVLNVVLEHGLDAAAGAVLQEAVRRWAKRRRLFRDREGAKAAVYIWGPNGEILKTIELPEPQVTPSSRAT